METVRFLICVFYCYLLAGVIFAAFFLWRGAAQLDHAAKGISWKTRVFLFPGSAALWPVLLRKWLVKRN
ncbi:MAG: hypothetical protein IPJ82_14825 [Lewinellaceae bacterium]|nr:hypothetical protein [Lewinellaceae bacterium]